MSSLKKITIKNNKAINFTTVEEVINRDCSVIHFIKRGEKE